MNADEDTCNGLRSGDWRSPSNGGYVPSFGGILLLRKNVPAIRNESVRSGIIFWDMVDLRGFFRKQIATGTTNTDGDDKPL